MTRPYHFIGFLSRVIIFHRLTELALIFDSCYHQFVKRNDLLTRFMS